MHDAVVASRNMGKWNTTTQQQDNYKSALQDDDWWTTDERQQLLGKLRSSEAANRRLQERLDAIENIQASNQPVGKTPMVKSIATTPSVKGNSDFQTIREAGVSVINDDNNANDNHGDEHRIVIVSIIINCERSFSDSGSPSSLIESGAICQLGGGGPPGGGDGDFLDEEDGHIGSDNNGRTDYYNEFTFVCLNKVVIPTFIGKNLITTPYMPFNKAVRKLKKPKINLAYNYCQYSMTWKRTGISSIQIVILQRWYNNAQRHMNTI